MTPTLHVLLISCADSRGLIHRITAALARHSLNITENHEYVDRNNGMFFMRTEVEGTVNVEALLSELRQDLPTGAEVEFRPQTARKLVILATKEPHCLGDLLLRGSSGELNAQILAVVSQYDELEDLVARFDIPFHHVPVPDGDRGLHESALEKVIRPYEPDFLVLAKYMRILSPSFVRGYPNRIINIHHSFLPAFVGKSPYTQAYERGVKIIGATAHFVNESLDEGPIITQSVTSINHTQDPSDLARAGRDTEKIVLAKALHLVLENRVIVQSQKTIVFE